MQRRFMVNCSTIVIVADLDHLILAKNYTLALFLNLKFIGVSNPRREGSRTLEII